MTKLPARRRLVAALAVAAAAFALRAGFVLRQGPPAPLAGDALEYHAYADSLLTRGVFEGFHGDRATRMPGYPLFLAAIEALAGPSTRAVQLAQCLLGALTCLFVYFWAESILHPPWPIACAVAAACYFDLIAPSAWTLSESLYSCLLAGSLCALSRKDIPALWRAILGGAGFGLTYLVRPEILPFAVLILGASPFLLAGFARRGAALALGAFLLAVSPWVVRNALVFHRFIPTSSVGGWNFFQGLSVPLERLKLLPVQPRVPDGAGEFERDAAYRREYLELRASVPLSLQAKGYLFNLLTVYYPFLPEYDWTYALLVPFWLAGLWIAARRRDLWPAAGIVAGLSVIFALLAGPVSRYRFGFAPCLIILAGAGAQELRDRSKGRRFGWAAAGWTAANLVVWLAGGELRHGLLRLKAILWS